MVDESKRGILLLSQLTIMYSNFHLIVKKKLALHNYATPLVKIHVLSFHHFYIQTKVKAQPHETNLQAHVFLQLLSAIYVFDLSFRWLTKLSVSLVIGQRDSWFRFYSTQLKTAVSKWIYHTIMKLHVWNSLKPFPFKTESCLAKSWFYWRHFLAAKSKI